MHRAQCERSAPPRMWIMSLRRVMRHRATIVAWLRTNCKVWCSWRYQFALASHRRHSEDIMCVLATTTSHRATITCVWAGCVHQSTTIFAVCLVRDSRARSDHINAYAWVCHSRTRWKEDEEEEEEEEEEARECWRRYLLISWVFKCCSAAWDIVSLHCDPTLYCASILTLMSFHVKNTQYVWTFGRSVSFLLSSSCSLKPSYDTLLSILGVWGAV